MNADQKNEHDHEDHKDNHEDSKEKLKSEELKTSPNIQIKVNTNMKKDIPMRITKIRF